MGKEKKYTAEYAEETIKKLLALLNYLIDNCEDGDKIGVVFSYARYSGGAQVSDEKISAAADTLSLQFGNISMATVALAGFLAKFKEMGAVARNMETVNTKDVFGI